MARRPGIGSLKGIFIPPLARPRWLPLPARRGGLRTRYAARRGAAERSLDMPLRMG
jgi:hypothetical protein